MKKWNEINFATGTEFGKLPMILERLAGTPARIEDKIQRYPVQYLTEPPITGWSVQEHIGHILLLEKVWTLRIKEILDKKTELSGNIITENEFADNKFNEQNAAELLASFRIKRERMCYKISEVSPEEAALSSMHPRLKQLMTITDLAFFVCEHDDYHLSKMSEILRSKK